jgi:hypothetical protein
MSDPAGKISHDKRRRPVLASVRLLAALIAGGLVFALIEKVRDASDRAT